VSAQQPLARAREARTPSRTPASRATDRAEAGGKLTPTIVRAIRELVAKGMTDFEIAACYGVTPRMIGYVRTGKRWGSVT